MKPAKWTGLCLLLALLGCQNLGLRPWTLPEWNLFRGQAPEKETSRNVLDTTVETPLIGEFTRVSGLHLIVLEGVGLVTGLDGTGGDPPPSPYRERLLDDMRRRGVRNPNEILRDPNTTLVVVRAYLPPLVKKGERFDLEVRVPGDGETKSLNGGWLMETYLTEQAVVPGQGVLEGRRAAKGEGPIMIAMGEGDPESLNSVLRRGRVLSGGVSLLDRDMALYLRSDFRTVRNSARIADKVGQRFYAYNRSGIREPLAKAKSDSLVELQILPRYKDNFPRYLQVVNSIAFREKDVARRVRMEKLQEELNRPVTAERAALQLEAVGLDAVPMLKSALDNPSLEVRFHASAALAYLGDPDGLPHLAEAAREEPAFRVFAFAAMSAIEDAEAHLLLRELMSGTSSETRYGAFRALSTLDPNDPFIRGEPMPPTDDAKGQQFMLHVLHTEGAPMVHLTNHRKAEIVVFGADQPLRTPVAVRAGRHILVTGSPGSETVTVSRYTLSGDRRRTVPARVADVIRTVAEFGASYPDVAQLLTQAEKQHNLPGRLEVDALPRAGRLYYRPVDEGGSRRARVGSPTHAPNIFSINKEEDRNRAEEPPAEEAPAPAGVDAAAPLDDDDPLADERGTASLVDAGPDDRPAEDGATEKRRFDFLRFGRKR